MKIVILLFLIFDKTITYNRSCKTRILHTFGYHSRIAPNRVNSVCPNVSYNCCTNIDQMQLHKTWNLQTKKILKQRTKLFYKHFKDLLKQMKEIGDLNFEKITRQYMVKYGDRIDSEIYQHLDELVKEFFKIRNQEAISQGNTLLAENFKKVFKQVNQLRKSSFCLLCDYNSHMYINYESKVITYSKNFCKYIVANFLPTMKVKYLMIMKKLLLLNEWSFIIANYKLFEDNDVQKYLAYISAIQKCDDDKKKCLEFCLEFKPTEYSYMFDGEPTLIDELVKVLRIFYSNILTDQESFLKKHPDFDEIEFFQEYQTNHSMLHYQASNKIFEDADDDIEQKPEPKQFIERTHRVNSIQLEKLGNEKNILKIYKMSEQNIDFDDFLYNFADDPFDGINLQRLTRSDNFDVRKKYILGLIDNGVSSGKFINEYIEPQVEKLLKKTQAVDIARFKKDWSRRYKRSTTKMSGGAGNSHISRRMTFLEKFKIAVMKFALGTPPYAHPTLNPDKEQKRQYKLKKHFDPNDLYIELNDFK